MPIPTPVSLDPSTAFGGGLLTTSRPLPSGWQRGIAFTDTNCFLPTVMGECPSGSNLKPAQRGEATEFRPVSVIMAVECTTMGGSVTEGMATGALDSTREYALAREMLTGEASTRDRNPRAIDLNGDEWMGNPSLQSEAVDLGAAFTSVTAMVACLEQNLAAATAGRGGYILVGVGLATWLKSEDLIWRDGARWRTATGATVIVSAGFDGRSPADTVGPAAGDPLYAYAVADVWAGVGERAVYSDVDRADNTETSRAEDIALGAFSPCAVFAAASTVATAC